jgi:radical SAM/Cys-rich protein
MPQILSNASKWDDPIYSTGVPSFQHTLSENNLRLERDTTTTLQINIGLKCNQFCTHCHLDAGPGRNEMMAPQTMDQVVGFASQNSFETIDITGGAPELHPELTYFIEKLSPFTDRLILRSNLTALFQQADTLISVLKDHKICIVASFPSLNAAQAESLRGQGVFQTSINGLQKLNSIGYGMPDTGLELDLVVNPSGAFLPPPQGNLEARFKKVLNQKWGVGFNRLFSFANTPIGRFRKWLIKTGNFENYVKKLVEAFNPLTLDGLMCKALISVSWDGYLFDCDFNQAAGLYMGDRKQHISETPHPPAQGSPIAKSDHCYTCTAGTGFN